MELTIEIGRELEGPLRKEAARQGIDESQFVIKAVEDRLRQEVRDGSRLPKAESDLLQRINLGLPEDFWNRYNALKAKRDAESLMPEEQKELIACSDRVEAENTRRMSALLELAGLRGTTIDALMCELGLSSSTHA